jgi:thiol-disulfide isomerase/thioredoxin
MINRLHGPRVHHALYFGQSIPLNNPRGSEESLIPTVKSQTGFDEVITSHDKPVLVKFEKKHCPACEEAEPILKQIAEDNKDKLKVVKALMWDDTNPDNRSMKKLAWKYAIKTVPIFVLFEKGAEVIRGEGKSGLMDIVNEKGLAYNAYPAHLPAPYIPAEAKLTVLYDGECDVCKAASEKLKTLDKKDQLALIPLQAPQVRNKYPNLKLVDLRKSIHVVDNNGNVYKGAYAFKQMGKVIQAQSPMGFLFKTFSKVGKIPGVTFIADKIYLEFSKRRFMFKAKNSNCKNCTLEDTEG